MSFFILNIDNGKNYDAQKEWPALVCTTQAEVDAATKAFDAWVARLQAECEARQETDVNSTRIEGPEWEPPFWGFYPWSDEFIYSWERIEYSIVVVELKTWAEVAARGNIP